MGLKKIIIFLGIGIIGLSGIIYITWLSYDYITRKPKLLFSLPTEECDNLIFGKYDHYSYGPKVRRICKKRDYDSECVFAIIERKGIYFKKVNEEFDLKYTDGEDGTVYFYKYYKRFKKYIEVP